jgi:hypothetical protein
MNRPLYYAMRFPSWGVYKPGEAQSDMLVDARECARLCCLLVLTLSA